MYAPTYILKVYIQQFLFVKGLDMEIFCRRQVPKFIHYSN